MKAKGSETVFLTLTLILWFGFRMGRLGRFFATRCPLFNCVMIYVKQIGFGSSLAVQQMTWVIISQLGSRERLLRWQMCLRKKAGILTRLLSLFMCEVYILENQQLLNIHGTGLPRFIAWQRSPSESCGLPQKLEKYPLGRSSN